MCSVQSTPASRPTDSLEIQPGRCGGETAGFCKVRRWLLFGTMGVKSAPDVPITFCEKECRPCNPPANLLGVEKWLERRKRDRKGSSSN